MSDIVIISGARTPIGTFNGALSGVGARELAQTAIQAALSRAGLAHEAVDEVVMGCVLQAALGQNVARQASIGVGLPEAVPAATINQVCGSGLRAIAMARHTLLAGEADVVLAGGTENMSQAPHAATLRTGVKMGPAQFIDTMIIDGLWDVFNQYHMGITAENIAEQKHIDRARQDAFAVDSHNRAEKAQADGRFKEEIVPVEITHRKGTTTVEQDEHIRPGMTVEAAERLRPAFKKDGGTVTAANSSGINDGAAAVVVTTAERAKAEGKQPLGYIRSFAHAGVAPSIMGMGPVPAARKALERAGWGIDDVDLIELNEAFAAQSCGVVDDLGANPEKVNVNGGAIALGHPIGASGTRIVVTLLHEMARRDVTKGMAALCIGGGMGIAMTFERA